MWPNGEVDYILKRATRGSSSNPIIWVTKNESEKIKMIWREGWKNSEH